MNYLTARLRKVIETLYDMTFCHSEVIKSFSDMTARLFGVISPVAM